MLKKALVIVDAQNDFMDGALASDKDKKIRDAIYEKCKDAVKNNVDIFLTRDCHGDDYSNTSEGVVFPKHCQYGTDGIKIDTKIAEFTDIALEVIDKPTMGSDRLVRALLKREYDEIEIIGYVLEYCIFANAVMLKATETKTDIIVNLDYVAAVDESKSKGIIDVMSSFGIKIIGGLQSQKATKKEAKATKTASKTDTKSIKKQAKQSKKEVKTKK